MDNKTTQTQNAPVKPISAPLNPSARFTNTVFKQYGNCAGRVELTEYQKQLIQGYFVAIDRSIVATEEERVRKNSANKDHKYDNSLPCTWNNINMEQLALDVVHYSRMGLDMMQDNHLFPIPYKNNKKGNYDMTLMIGYNGIQYIAEKYALTPPTTVTIELVYDTDTFIPMKKGVERKMESYEFTINNPFDRGKVIGGFGYIEYDDPTKNKLIIMTKAAIEKRKPKYASANFWGGTQKTWDNGEKVEVETDGWYDEMCLKTLKREVYSAKHISRDPMRIDDSYRHMRTREAEIAQIEAETEIEVNANAISIDIAPPAELPPSTSDTKSQTPYNEPYYEAPPAEAPQEDYVAPFDGPAF